MKTSDKVMHFIEINLPFEEDETEKVKLQVVLAALKKYAQPHVVASADSDTYADEDTVPIVTNVPKEPVISRSDRFAKLDTNSHYVHLSVVPEINGIDFDLAEHEDLFLTRLSMQFPTYVFEVVKGKELAIDVSDNVSENDVSSMRNVLSRVYKEIYALEKGKQVLAGTA